MGSKPIITLRKTIEEDMTYVRQWLQQKDILEGFPMTNIREIDDSIRIWKLYIDKGSSITALYKKKPCGAAKLYVNDFEKIKHHALFVIVVDENMRNRGVGTLLIKNLFQLAKEKFNMEFLHLEVYENNAACHLYKRLGFKEYGCHPRFLKDKDGTYYSKVLMQRKL